MGKSFEPVKYLLVLWSDDGEKAFAERIGFALEGSEPVFEDIEVLGSKSNEAAFGEFGGKVVISIMIAGNDFLRASFKSVLAYNNGAFLAFFDVVWDKYYAIGDHIFENVEHNFVSGPVAGGLPFARAWIWREKLIVEAADELFVKIFAIRLGGCNILLDGAELEVLHELSARVGTFGKDSLVVLVDF